MYLSRIFDMDYITAKIYYYDNINQHRKVVRDRRRSRRDTDPLFRLITNMRSRLHIAFKNRNWQKESTTSQLLGCDLEQVMKHIESKFKQGMSWENYGKWHIDHIIPLCSAKTPDDVSKLCHFSNLQPLWALDNIRKKGKQN